MCVQSYSTPLSPLFTFLVFAMASFQSQNRRNDNGDDADVDEALGKSMKLKALLLKGASGAGSIKVGLGAHLIEAIPASSIYPINNRQNNFVLPFFDDANPDHSGALFAKEENGALKYHPYKLPFGKNESTN